MEYKNESNIRFLKLTIPNEKLSILVENEIFHEFNHKILIDNSQNVILTIYYTNWEQLLKLVNLLTEKNLLCE